MIIFISRMLTSGDLIPIPLGGHNDFLPPCPQRCSCLTLRGDFGHRLPGFSLNLRNDNLILKNVSIRFAFYPKGPPDIHSIEVNVSSRRKSGFYDYRVYKPDAIKYE